MNNGTSSVNTEKKTEDFAALTGALVENGAAKAAVIPTSDVVLDAAFRDMCKANYCGMYGRCWMCPPDVGEIEDLMAEIRTYSHVLVFQTISELEDSFDVEGMYEAGSRHNRLAMKVRTIVSEHGIAERDGKKPLHLCAGGCRVCSPCKKQSGEPCANPDLAMSSLEAYGVNVSKMAEAAGMKYIHGANTVTYFGAVFFNL